MQGGQALSRLHTKYHGCCVFSRDAVQGWRQLGTHGVQDTSLFGERIHQGYAAKGGRVCANCTDNLAFYPGLEGKERKGKRTALSRPPHSWNYLSSQRGGDCEEEHSQDDSEFRLTCSQMSDNPILSLVSKSLSLFRYLFPYLNMVTVSKWLLRRKTI